MRLGKPFEYVIKCKIRGLRSKQTTRDTLMEPDLDDGTRIVKIKGCDYRIPKEEIVAWMELYGEIQSEISEDCFNDEFDQDGKEGTNRTGVYSIKMKLDMAISQLLPMSGRLVRMYHKGIQKLCTNCFGNHTKRVCQSQKVLWVDYVRKFVNNNPDIPLVYFGKWIDILKSEEQKLSRRNTDISRSENKQIIEAPTTEETRSNKQKINIPAPEARGSQKINTQQEDQQEDLVVGDADPGEIETENESQPPTMKDFDIPENDEEYETMLERLMGCGMKQSEVQQASNQSKRNCFQQGLQRI